eukprot:TRINITY_DN5445_c0_g1_i11.p1 TRINITY_DN5445_c0_g1~~TRINITY_DN5445_c0_g1_i11.p1  ORF type:complete len:398 (+),score=114.49 TRINITY_DN5445_c0_g1_i11:184-1377(+)
MDDKYFEDLFNEEREPFPNFISRLDSYPSSPFNRYEFQPELDNPIDKLDLENYKLQPTFFSLDNNGLPKYKETNELGEVMEELKEDDSSEGKGSENKGSDGLKEPHDQPRAASKAKAKCLAKLTYAEESLEDKRETRADRNKRYAKESRERKKKYVEGLEQQVKTLRREVEVYKAKLKNYELIEKFKNTLGYEFYDALRKAQNIMLESHKSLTENEIFKQCVNEVFQQLLDEQIDALKLVTKMLVDICLPVPMRVSIWLANKDLEEMDAKAIAKIMSPVISLEQIQAIIDYEKKLDPDGSRYAKFKTTMKKISKSVKDSLKKIVDCQRDIVNQFRELGKFMMGATFAYHSPYILEMHAKMDIQLSMNPEVRECGIEKLLEKLKVDSDKEEPESKMNE